MRTGALSDNEDLEAVSFITPEKKLVVAMHALADMPVTISGLRRAQYQLVIAGPDAAGAIVTSVTSRTGVLTLDVKKNATYRLAEH